MHEIISSQDIYWITRLDEIKYLLISSFVVLLAISIGWSMGRWMYNSDNYRNPGDRGYVKHPLTLKFLYVLTVLVLLGNMFVPTTKDLVAIKLIPAIVNNENVQGVGVEFIDLAKDWLKELHPEHSNKK